jgi:MFS family permease
MTSVDEATGPQPGPAAVATGGGGGGFLGPYLEIFAIPRAWQFSLAGIIGRLPMAMYGLGLVLLISAGTGRYALAGTVSAAAALGNAACVPQFGRLTDRLGQRRVLIPICLVFALSVAGLVAAVQLHGPDWTLFAAGIAGGATMPMLGPMARARWSALLTGSPRLHTAFSVESIADEVCFVVGPAGVTLLATQVAPAAGVICAALCCLAGTLWFASQRSTEPRAVTAPEERPRRRIRSRRGFGGGIRRGGWGAGAPQSGGHRGPGVMGGGSPPCQKAVPRGRYSLAAPGLAVMVPAYLFIGSMFVSVDLSTVDFATRSGHKPLAGLVLGCYALGSAIGGLWYGSRNWRAPSWRRFAITLILTVSGVCTFWAMPSLLVLASVISLCGLTIAPTLIAGYSLLESTALPGRSTEAMSWLGTGISVGVALGATSVGFILDALGPRWGYGFAACCGVTAVLIYLAGLRRIARAPVRPT